MGRISLPDISKVEEVLELITNQDKYVKYMNEIVVAHKAAKEALGDLQTKEQADVYLAQAADRHASAVRHETDAKAALAKAQNDVSQQTQDLAQEKRHWQTEYKSQADLQRQAGLDLAKEKEAFDTHVFVTSTKLKEEADANEALRLKLVKENERVDTLKAKFEKATKALE